MFNIRARYRNEFGRTGFVDIRQSLRRGGDDIPVERFVVLYHVAQGEALFEFFSACGS